MCCTVIFSSLQKTQVNGLNSCLETWPEMASSALLLTIREHLKSRLSGSTMTKVPQKYSGKMDKKTSWKDTRSFWILSPTKSWVSISLVTLAIYALRIRFMNGRICTWITLDVGGWVKARAISRSKCVRAFQPSFWVWYTCRMVRLPSEQQWDHRVSKNGITGLGEYNNYFILTSNIN
jgi:hypothetical protein